MALEEKLFKWRWDLGTIAVDLKIAREISVYIWPSQKFGV